MRRHLSTAGRDDVVPPPLEPEHPAVEASIHVGGHPRAGRSTVSTHPDRAGLPSALQGEVLAVDPQGSRGLARPAVIVECLEHQRHASRRLQDHTSLAIAVTDHHDPAIGDSLAEAHHTLDNVVAGDLSLPQLEQQHIPHAHREQVASLLA